MRPGALLLAVSLFVIVPAGDAAAGKGTVPLRLLVGTYKLVRSSTGQGKKARWLSGALVLSPMGTFSLSRVYVVGSQTHSHTIKGLFTVKGRRMKLVVSNSTDRSLLGTHEWRFYWWKRRLVFKRGKKKREIWYRWSRRHN